MEKTLSKYPDEDQIENVLDHLYLVAWEHRNLTHENWVELIGNIRWVLNVWDKNYMGNKHLSQIIEKCFLSELNESSSKNTKYKELDLVICFFQHYIYAFEEFMNRGFRDCVIRCGLICERFIKRLAVADNHQEVLAIPKFEARANRLMSLLESRCDEIHFLVERMKSIYSKRTKKGAHDTGAAGMLISKSCIIQIPIAFMEYLNCLERIGYSFRCKDELLDLINSTVAISTTLMVTKAGEPTKPESVLETLYRQGYFECTRALKDVENKFREAGYVFPRTSLWRALNNLCDRKMLTKPKHNCYIQRMPPQDYYAKEMIE